MVVGEKGIPILLTEVSEWEKGAGISVGENIFGGGGDHVCDYAL